MIVLGSLKAQEPSLSSNSTEQLRNMSIQLVDTTLRLGDLLDKCYEIALYAEKLKADRDSLILIVAQKDSVIAYDDSIYIAQLDRDSAQTKVFYKLRGFYTSLEKDYNALKQSKKLRLALGVGGNLRYSLPNNAVNGGGMNISPGLFIKDRYLVTLDVGLDVLKVDKVFDIGVVFGGRTVLIF